MAYGDIIYTPITLKAGDPIPANAVMSFNGQWYLKEVDTEISDYFGKPSVPVPDKEFWDAMYDAACKAYEEKQEEIRIKNEKKYQAYLAEREAAHQAFLRELDF